LKREQKLADRTKFGSLALERLLFNGSGQGAEFCSFPTPELRANDVPTFLVRTSNAKNGYSDPFGQIINVKNISA
jgi:hypothetical protein